MIFRQRLMAIHAHKSFEFALAVVDQLNQKGYQTVFAGGCVRDSIWGVTPKDLDIATAAPPEAVEALFSRTLPVGKAFGTIVVVSGGFNFEVTTFRSDGPYKDGRHPESVVFTGIEEDARRRDFTVNALFYDPLREEILDFVGGMEDLHKARLRTVGSPMERFGEDHLRMLRAVRFVAQLGFKLDSAAMQAIQVSHGDLAKVSVERIFNEVKRLLESRHLKRGLECLRESLLYKVFWPEFECFDVDTIVRYPVFVNWENVFALIMMDVVAAEPEARLRAWKVSRESQRRVHEQLSGVRQLLNPESTRADRARILGGDVFSEVLTIARGKTQEPERIDGYVKEYLSIASPLGMLPRPFVNGADLLRAGFTPGAKMGETLKALFDAQLEGKLCSRAEALERLKEITV